MKTWSMLSQEETGQSPSQVATTDDNCKSFLWLPEEKLARLGGSSGDSGNYYRWWSLLAMFEH